MDTIVYSLVQSQRATVLLLQNVNEVKQSTPAYYLVQSQRATDIVVTECE